MNLVKEMYNNMAQTEQQNVTSPRQQMLDLASKRFPDRRFPGQTGPDGLDGKDDLEQAILDILSEKDQTIADGNSKNKQLVDLFLNDPASLDLFTRWVETKDLGAALVDVFGDDLPNLSTDEGRAQYSKNLEAWRGRKSENDRIETERQENIKKSLEDLEAWGNEKGLTVDQKVAIFLRLVEIAANGISNIYTRDDFDMVLKETNFDSAVEAARREGEVAGRNEKIAAARLTRSVGSNMPPSFPGGQGLRGAERQPVDEEENPFAGIK